MGGQKRCVSLPIKCPQLRPFESCWDCFASSGGTSPWCPVPSPTICPARKLLGSQGPSVVHDLRDPARHRDLGDSNRFGRLVKTPVIGPHSRHVIRVHSEHGTVLNGSTAKIPGCRKVTIWGQCKCVADRAALLEWNEFRVAWRVTHSVFYRVRIEGIPNVEPLSACSHRTEPSMRYRQSPGVGPQEILPSALGRMGPKRRLQQSILVVPPPRKSFLWISTGVDGGRKVSGSHAPSGAAGGSVAGRTSLRWATVPSLELRSREQRTDQFPLRWRGAQGGRRDHAHELRLVVTEVATNTELLGNRCAWAHCTPGGLVPVGVGGSGQMVSGEEWEQSYGPASEDRPHVGRSLEAITWRHREQYPHLPGGCSPRRQVRVGNADTAVAVEDNREGS
jgi:hypothetical protein